ncbi:MAG: SAM-dependent methyltransferase [Euryarchaeota archaeon]|nr:SAM-dependent methyltransferase [Euryarchaeota archaeon]
MKNYSQEELESLRERILKMAREAESKSDPLIWFEELYSSSEGNEEMIPWSNGEPNHLLVEWLSDKPPQGRALVVGCGLGEDAAYLSELGWKVTAFDISPTAIRWAAQTYGNLDIEWRVEDLLNLPMGWHNKWDLVVEVHILQAIPEEVRVIAAPILPSLLASSGRLVSVGRVDISGEETQGPPWPLSRDFILSIGGDLEHTSLHLPVELINGEEIHRYISSWKHPGKKI